LDFLQNHIEALIFCSPTPIRLGEIRGCLSEMFNADVPEEDIQGAIQRLGRKISGRRIFISTFQSRWRVSIPDQASLPGKYRDHAQAAIEETPFDIRRWRRFRSLPTSNRSPKTEIENIRGVNCDYAVQKLLDKGLIEITGKAETIGRPMLYGTTIKFMEYFGINDIAELPTPKEFVTEVNSIGETLDQSEPLDQKEESSNGEA
jgi:segregation and condensation protein B